LTRWCVALSHVAHHGHVQRRTLARAIHTQAAAREPGSTTGRVPA
jgi:hypothetical protein